jgi:succinate dehydrogenase / fumarate reductase cytochrome b subunit
LEGQERARNRRGVLGWLNPYHYNLERWAYTFQRVTGLAVLAYVIGHIGDTSFFVGGPFGSGPSTSSWAIDLSITEGLVGHLILILTVLVVTFHGVNGIRLMLAEYGIIFEKPGRVDYPYRARGLRTLQQHMIWLAIFLALVAALWAAQILFA